MKKTSLVRQITKCAHPPNSSRFHRSAVLRALLLSAFTGMTVAQTVPRVNGPVDDSTRAIVAHSHRVLSNAVDLGTVPGSQQFGRMTLVLQRSAEQQQALTAFLDSQQTRGSAEYHHWLTPEEFGQKFGPAPEDLARIQNWLQQEGFRVNSVAKSGMWIEFSGTVDQVNAAFRTQMHSYQLNGETHISNSTDLSIPAALAPLIEGVPLNDFFTKPAHVQVRAQSSPTITASWNNANAITPGDFATIYDLLPLYKQDLNGSGQTIAIVGEADILPSDVATFQKIFGLPSNPVNLIENGPDPGFETSRGLSVEASIDTEWADAVAPGATIDLVVTGPQQTSDPAALSAAYIVDQNLAQIVSVSFGACEQTLGSAQNALWDQLWEQAAAQGMSVFVAAGDAGAAGCASAGVVNGGVEGPAAVSGVASSPYVTGVGGTEFDETVNGGSISTFWNTTNASNLESAIGYIPEMVWNDSCGTSLWCPPPQGQLPTFAAGGGGISAIYPTPSWQTLPVTGLSVLSTYSLPGQPDVSPRGVPDVSLASSAMHDGYLFCYTADASTPDCQATGGTFTKTTFQNEAGGTSFAAPAFAGIMAIVNQKVASSVTWPNGAGDGRQGLANYVLYTLAESEQFSSCNSSSETLPASPTPAACTFHDITSGTNTPLVGYRFVTGYDAAPGYDLASGLGSVDAANLVANWVSAVTGFQGTQTALSTDPPVSSIAIGHGQSVTLNVSVQSLASGSATGTPTGNISLIAQGGTLPGSVGVTAVPLSGSAGAATTGDFSVSNLPGGTYNLVARFPGDGAFAGSISNPVPVTITPESSTTTLQASTTNGSNHAWTYAGFDEFTANVAGTTGEGTPSGFISFLDNGTTLAKVKLDNLGNAYLYICPFLGPISFFPPVSSLPCPAIGNHVFTAVYSGDTSFTGSPTPPGASQIVNVQISQGILLGGINVTPTQSDPNYTLEEPLTFSSGPQASPNAAVPTGTMQFFQGSTALGSPVPLTGNPPTASVANVVLPQGADTITATYSGDSNYVPTSYSTLVNWGVPVGWSAATTVATVNPGQTATYNLSLSASGFSGTATIICVQGMDFANPTQTVPGANCMVNPASVTLMSSGPAVPVTVTIATDSLSQNAPSPFHSWPLTVPPALALGLWWTRKGNWRRAFACILAVLVIGGISSCGGAATGSTTPNSPPAVSGVFSVWALTPSSSTETVYTAVNLTLNVNQ
jgi:large repetitive protein